MKTTFVVIIGIVLIVVVFAYFELKPGKGTGGNDPLPPPRINCKEKIDMNDKSLENAKGIINSRGEIRAIRKNLEELKDPCPQFKGEIDVLIARCNKALWPSD